MSNIARKVKKQINYDVTRNNLLNLCRDKGYDVIYYDPEKGHSMIRCMGADDYAKRARAFTAPQARVVFVRQGYDADTEAYLLAHELGHIMLGHNAAPNNDDDVKQEREANRFAETLLKPNRLLRMIYTNKRVAILLLLTTVISLTIGICIGRSTVDDTVAALLTMLTITNF